MTMPALIIEAAVNGGTAKTRNHNVWSQLPSLKMTSARLNRASMTFLCAPPLMLSGNHSILHCV